MHALKGIKRFRLSLALVMMLASGASFWFARPVSSAPELNICTVCHKLTTTLTLTCNSLDYRRHKDHGDPDGPCASSQ